MTVDAGKQDKISVVITPAAGVAGTSDINSSEIDMQNFESVLFIVTFGVITATAVTSIKAQQDTVTGMAGAADLAGTAQTIADSDDEKVFYISVVKPLERFVRLVVDRGTANAVCSAVAIQSGAKKAPVTHGSNVAGESHYSPIEGTA